MTLVELLVVISIIGVLAGLLMPALAGAKKRAKILASTKDMADLKGAISVYQNDYSRLPASTSAATLGTDFTYGATVASTGFGTNVVNNNNAGYQESNRELMVILTASSFPNYLTAAQEASVQNDQRNPRKTGYFHAKSAPGSGATAGPGLGTDGVMRDPWGNPYIIALDLNYDGWVSNSIYNDNTVNGATTGLARQGAAGSSTWALKDSVMIFSFGPDGQFAPSFGPGATVTSVAANVEPNRDNVLSWK